MDRKTYRRLLELPVDKTIVALLPGSRKSELMRHSDLFIRTAMWLNRRNSGLHFVAPFASRETREIFEEAIKRNDAGGLPIALLDEHSRDVMAAADIVLLALGTATLEAALLERVMVVTYKLSFLNYWLLRGFVRIKLYSLPNILAGCEIVPELIQIDAVPEKLGEKVEYYLRNPEKSKSVTEALRGIHRQLRRNANEKAADAVLGVLRSQAGRA